MTFEHLYELRDPIHGSIKFNEREKSVIDHRFFQRLRYIYQLGLTDLVYPGAVHNRFIHGLGAMHVAGKLFNKILGEKEYLASFFNEEETKYMREVVRFAGLLHDIGHMPFSHAAETAMPNFCDLKIPREWFSNYDESRQATHED